MTKRNLISILIIGVGLITLALGVAIRQESEVSASRLEAPYAQSAIMDGIVWDKPTYSVRAVGSDLWPTTWAGDGNVYTSWGDGGGFGGDNNSGRVSMGFARIKGIPPNIDAKNVNGGSDTENVGSFACRKCGKTAGLISVDGIFYSWVNMQNGNPPETRLHWSEDLAKTWHALEWAFPDVHDSTFFPATFLNFGKDYEGARDEYVYSYGAKWIWSQGPEDNIYLMRVPRDQIKRREAYEFFGGVGISGNAEWTSDITQRKPVFSDSNGVNNAGLANVIYNSGINRYILTVAHRKDRESLVPDVSRLGIFEATEPWGPWRTVVYYDRWLGFEGGEALNYEIPTKWISDDGSKFWIVFSSTAHDQFNLIRGKFLLNDP